MPAHRPVAATQEEQLNSALNSAAQHRTAQRSAAAMPRYFLMRSADARVVERAVTKGMWPVSHGCQERLNDAFASGGSWMVLYAGCELEAVTTGVWPVSHGCQERLNDVFASGGFRAATLLS